MAIIAERKFTHEIELTADWSKDLRDFKRAVEVGGELRVDLCQDDNRYGVLRIPERHWILQALDDQGLKVGSKWTLNKRLYI